MSALFAALLLALMTNGAGLTVATVDDRSLCEISKEKPIEGKGTCNPEVKLGNMGTVPRWLKDAPKTIDEALKSLEGGEEEASLPRESRQD